MKALRYVTNRYVFVEIQGCVRKNIKYEKAKEAGRKMFSLL